MGEVLHSVWYGRRFSFRVSSLVVGGAATLIAVTLAYRSPNPSLTGPFAAALIGGTAVWMLSSARTYLTLAALMLYLGLADGVIKLMTSSSTTTLGRDLLLYAIVIGVLVRRTVRGEKTTLPPLSGWIVAFVAVVAVQVFNPGNSGTSHSLASTRPHLEFIPLFFFGYTMMQTQRRLKGFLMLLIAIAAINGAVSLVQFSETPSQLASWGPGYAARINGTDGTSGRGFTDRNGQTHTRPFALGSDSGFGGSVGMLAVPAVLALLALQRNRRLKIATGALSVGVLLAIVTSQSRTNVVAAVLAVLAFMMLATSSRRAFRLVFGLGIALVIGYGAISVLSSHTSSSLFSRYASIQPGNVVGTTINYRKGTFAEIPQYMGQYPLGAGIGKVGPAATGYSGLDAESEPTYLLVELGVPGLIVFLGFQLRILLMSMKVRRLRELESRLLLAALASPLFAAFIAGVVGITTATSPGAPYLWFAAGVLTYWLFGKQRRRDGPDLA